MRILAAEDAASVRALIEVYLAKAGHGLDLAADGAEALERFKARAYDLVVLDVQMPVLDGLAAAAAMRAHERESGRAPAPLLALTGAADPADARRCREAGFTATVAKPFTRESLLAAVAAVAGAAPSPSAIKADPELADLIPRFLDNCRVEAAEMRRALAREDYAALARTGHRLIGAGTSFGFPAVTAAARLIETAAKDADPAAAGQGLDELADYLATVKVRYE